MPRDPNRTRRIESEIQRVVSDLLRREVNDPRIGSVTITAVQISPDLGHARLFYLPFDSGRDAAEVQAGLDGAARFMRGRVGRALKLRIAPEIVFARDEQLARGMQLSELIDSAVASDQQRHAPDEHADSEDRDRGE
jgi:ribosome-binding factor A